MRLSRVAQKLQFPGRRFQWIEKLEITQKCIHRIPLGEIGVVCVSGFLIKTYKIEGVFHQDLRLDLELPEQNNQKEKKRKYMDLNIQYGSLM